MPHGPGALLLLLYGMWMRFRENEVGGCVSASVLKRPSGNTHTGAGVDLRCVHKAIHF